MLSTLLDAHICIWEPRRASWLYLKSLGFSWIQEHDLLAYWSQSGNNWCWEVALLPDVVWSVGKLPALFAGAQHPLTPSTQWFLFLPKLLPCRSVQHHDSKPPPQCCTLQWFTFLLVILFIHSFASSWVLSLTVLALEQQTPGWDEPGRGHLQSAPSDAGAKGPCAEQNTRCQNQVLGYTSMHSVWSKLFVNFWGTVFSVGGLENIHCFLSKIFIHSVTTYCFYPIYVLEDSGLYVNKYFTELQDVRLATA